MALIIGPNPGAAAGVTGSLWDLQISGNTTGTTGLVSSGTLSLAGGTNITLSQSATNKISIIGPTNIVSAAIIGGNTTGTTASISSGTLSLAGGNNITLSQVANAITISAFSQTVQTQNLHADIISGNTTGTTASISSGTMVLAGGNNITLSQNGQSVTISAAGNTLSFWQPFYGSATNRQFGQSTIHFDPMMVPSHLSISRADMEITNSISTSALSSFAAALSLDIGFYTRTGSTLTLATSSATNYQFSDVSGASSSILSGNRIISCPIVANLTPGEYWFAFLSRTTITANDWITMSNYNFGMPLQAGFLGVTTASSNNLFLGQGIYTAQSAALPNSLGFTDIKANANAFVNRIVVGFCNLSA